MLGFLKSFSSNIHYNYSVQSRSSFEVGGWTVYDAKHKTSGELVSVFVMSKKKISEQISASGIRPRTASTQEVFDFATKGVQQLTKIRHPAILKLVEPLEASKSSMTFATERVSGTLEQHSDWDDLQIVRGLTTVVQALQFLHAQLGMCHHNVTPQTVFIDQQGDWKIGGFEFVVKYDDYQPGGFQLPILDPRMPSFVQPSFDYLAPELVLGRTAVPANDVWGLACLIYALYLRKPPMRLHGNSNAYREELAKFRHQISSSVVVNKLPQALHSYIPSLFCEDPQGRITLDILETTTYFQNPLIKALKSMDDFAAKPVEDKVSFLKHFQTLLPQFPKQMRIRKIAKFAVRELSGPRDPTTGSLIGNVLFSVCADMSRLGFQEQVLPVFSKLVDYFPFQESVAANLAVISKNTNDKDFSKSVLPVITETLKHHDAQHTALQTQLLSQAKVYGDNLTVSKMEQQLFPAVINCFAATPARSVKVSATQCLAVLVNRNVSKQLIIDNLIPALKAMKTRDPVVVVAVGDLWKDVCARLNSEQIFTLGLPHLLEISLAKRLTVEQFKHLMSIVNSEIETVSKEQIKLLVNNEPAEEDDWLNEPVSVTGPSSSTTTKSASQSEIPAPASQEPTSTKPSSSSFTSSAPSSAASSRNPTPGFGAVPVLNINSSSGSSKPGGAAATPALPEPPKTFDTIIATQKNKELPKPKSSAPSMPALVPLQPSKPNSSSTEFPVLQPLSQAPKKAGPMDDEDDFGSFVSSNQSKGANNTTSFDSLI